MKPIKTKATKVVHLFRIMDMDITEQQLKQAQAWYQSAKNSSKQGHTNVNGANNMKDIYLIKRARKIMQQPRPLPTDTVMQLNILERQLKVPSAEFDEFFNIAIRDMNIISICK